MDAISPLRNWRTLQTIDNTCRAVILTESDNAPNFEPRDLVVFRPCADPAGGSFVIIRIASMKRNFVRRYIIDTYNREGRAVGRFEPVNSRDFPTFEGSDDAVIIGVVVEVTLTNGCSSSRQAARRLA